MLTLLELTREYPLLYYLVAFLSVYIAYYVCYVVKKPALSCNSKYQEFLMHHCPIFTEKYYPTVWCIETKLMTILRYLLQSLPPMLYRKEILKLKDGGQVALDWVDNESSQHPPESRPTCILMPGITGSSHESYMRHWALQTTGLGYRAVVFNNRGHGGAILKTPKTYTACETDDLKEVIDHVKQKYPDAPLMAAGVSLGGLILTNYLAETGEESGLVGAMTCSAPWNVLKSADSLETPLNCWVYNRPICYSLKDSVKKYEYIFKDLVDLEKVYLSPTIRDFDSNFIVKMYNYKSVIDYYTLAAIHNKIHFIKTPLLALNAADDDFSPLEALPLEEASKSENVCIAVTTRGGHIGFCEGLIPTGPGFKDRVFAQYADAVFQHRDKLSKMTG